MTGSIDTSMSFVVGQSNWKVSFLLSCAICVQHRLDPSMVIVCSVTFLLQRQGLSV